MLPAQLHLSRAVHLHVTQAVQSASCLLPLHRPAITRSLIAHYSHARCADILQLDGDLCHTLQVTFPGVSHYCVILSVAAHNSKKAICTQHHAGQRPGTDSAPRLHGHHAWRLVSCGAA